MTDLALLSLLSEFPQALHDYEYNLDPARFDGVIASWLTSLGKPAEGIEGHDHRGQRSSRD
ncbi:hypothetical protein [Microbacterium sp. SMR1]|uniref:hypothetical protein n=1 Tax=Microbacterium sp. SMR1 TaxID=1497340 RepID=UPI0011BDE404|nr:hypothetical protein [Microbacterium sp. SMR1]